MRLEYDRRRGYRESVDQRADAVGEVVVEDGTEGWPRPEAGSSPVSPFPPDDHPGMKDALLRGHLVRFRELLGTAWEAKRRMSPHISSGFIVLGCSTGFGTARSLTLDI